MFTFGNRKKLQGTMLREKETAIMFSLENC
jgi:hypothetical protein